MKKTIKKIFALVLSFAMVFTTLPAAAYGAVAKTEESVELPDYIFSEQWNAQYDVLYHEADKTYTYKNQEVTFNGENLTVGDKTYEIRNAVTEIAVKTEFDKATVTFTNVKTPVGAISGEWNTTKTEIHYMDGETAVKGDAAKIVLSGLAEGRHKLTSGTVYEKANKWSPGTDFGDGKGVVTEREFGYLPDVEFEIVSPFPDKEDGVYTGTGNGKNGNITVGVHIKNHKIIRVEEIEQNETPGFWSTATGIFGKIVEKQSADVDVMTGATLSSNGIKEAVNDALTKDKPDSPLPAEPENPGTPVDPSELPEGYIGVSVGSDVPASFENDLWTQYDYKELAVGETAVITPRRVPEAVVNTTDNDLEMPHFNYEIISGDAVELDGDNNLHQGIKAVKNGNAVVKITYDAHRHSNGNVNFPAVDPVNTQYVVYSVGGDKSIELTDDVKATKYDTIYFTKGRTADYPVTVTAPGAEVTVKCNGLAVEGKDGKFSVPLENRYNIVEITAAKDGKTRSIFHVISARKIKVNIENASKPGAYIAVNNKAKVSFNGIKMPLYKLATIYNPCFGNGAMSVKYEMGGKTYSGRCGQWDLATNNSFIVDFDSTGDKNFTGGKIEGSWWGEELGADKTLDGPGEPNLNADTHTGTFSVLPDFAITVVDATPAKEIQLDKKEVVLEIDETAKLGGTILPEESSYTELVFSSENPEVATVDQKGNIKGVKTGTTTIKAAVKGMEEISAVCSVTVKRYPYEQAVEAIDRLPDADTIKVEFAWDVKKNFAEIDSICEKLGDDISRVTNYDKYEKVRAKVDELLSAQQYRLVAENGEVLEPGRIVKSIEDIWGGDPTNVYEVVLPAGVSEVTVESYVPVTISDIKDSADEGFSSCNTNKTFVRNEKKNYTVNVDNAGTAAIKDQYYNDGKFDGPWEGEWIDVQYDYVRFDDSLPYCNFYFHVQPQAEDYDTTPVHFIFKHAETDLENGTASLEGRNFIETKGGYKTTATGKEITAEPVVKNLLGEVLTEGKDYELVKERVSAPGKYTFEAKGIGKYSGSLELNLVVTPEVVKGVNIRPASYDGGYDDAYITWKKSEGATGYQVYARRPSKTADWTCLGRTEKNSFLEKNLYDGYKYEFRVIPYFTADGTRYTTRENFFTEDFYTMKQVTMNSVKKLKGGKALVSWKGISGKSGYQIMVKGAGKTSYYKAEGTSLTLKTIKNKKYTYRVRAYKYFEKNGKTYRAFAPWSKAKTYTLH